MWVVLNPFIFWRLLNGIVWQTLKTEIISSDCLVGREDKEILLRKNITDDPSIHTMNPPKIIVSKPNEKPISAQMVKGKRTYNVVCHILVSNKQP